CWTIGGLVDVVWRVFQQLGVDLNTFLVTGQHQTVNQWHQNEQGDHNRQVKEGEDGVGGPDDADLVFRKVARGGNGQWYRTGQATVPDQKAGVGTGNQQAVVHADLTGQLFGEQGTDHQA